MKYCANCGDQMNDDSKKCFMCGAEFGYEKCDKVFCSKCGVENNNDIKFCCECGHSIDVIVVNNSKLSIREETDLAYYKANLQMQQEALKLQKQQLIVQQRQFKSMAKCPRCGSTSLAGNKKGFGIGKAVLVAAIGGSLGLIAGNLGAKKVLVTCLKCGKKYKA